VAFGIRTALSIPQRAIVTVTTNVPGPREQLYLLGRPIREILPYVPIAERMRIGVSVFTYGGQAAFGITTDFASVPEADRVAADIVAELAALTDAASAPEAEPVTTRKPAPGPTAAPAMAAAATPPRRKPAAARAQGRRRPAARS
jgi:diacylglycerol O-acyltransferase